MLDSYSHCCPYDLFIMGLFSFFSVNAINRRAYVRLEDMIQDRFATKLTKKIFIDKILRAYSICYLPYEYHLTP